MLFVEFRFFWFFLAVFAVYWSLRENRTRKIWLLLCSYFFYACWNWKFLFLIMASSALDYLVGTMLARTEDPRARRGWLILSLCANLGTIAFFKYYNFFVTSAAALLAWLGLHPSLHTLNIIIPVGVSFYTFHSMSYTIDVYRGKLKPVSSILDLACFIGFFPQMVAGPIVRASAFLPQLQTIRRFADVDGRGALVLFLTGFIKKACIADAVAPFVDRYFDAPWNFTMASAWVAVLFYAIQIYCDFSGYTDMAIATAGLLGYQLPVNFRFPYFAKNISDFWHRWHISLSSWLRDYLYIPLGGNRGPAWFVYRNIMITMLLGGLWHGGAWTFVIWGGLHGLALIVHREWQRRIERRAPSRPLPTLGEKHGRHGGRPSKARDHGLARLGVDRLLGLPGLDIFPRRRSAARRAGVAKFSVSAQRRHRGPRRVDALDRRGAWLHPLAELPRSVFGVVAPPPGPGVRRRIRLRVRGRALIYPAALRALHLLPILRLPS